MSAPNVERTVTTLLVGLARADVDFVVVGGIACLLHGVQRTTADVDLCVRLDQANLSKLVELAARLCLRLRAPEPLEALADASRRQAWIDEKGAMVATLISPDSPLQIDVFLRYPIEYQELRDRATSFVIDGVSVLVSSREDLVRAKRSVSPPRRVDSRDIEDLEELIRRDRKP
ncbi:MAG: hypothetical protein JNM94_08525 [Phycisphaerae bacterium]|nr:hypothetical protein [Phycisphaerae bacterium]